MASFISFISTFWPVLKFEAASIFMLTLNKATKESMNAMIDKYIPHLDEAFLNRIGWWENWFILYLTVIFKFNQFYYFLK